MKKVSFTLFLLLFGSYFIQAQSSKLSIKATEAEAFYTDLAQSTLVVPITDKKDPEEKALLDAVKKYWTICPYKSISRKVFNEMQNNKSQTPPNTFYLIKETYERRKHRKKDWAYTKYFITKTNVWVEDHDELYIEFKLPLKTVKYIPTEVPCGYLFGIMIKHFDTELKLMKDLEAYANSFSRKRLVKANFRHSLKPYAGRKLLVGNSELENQMINLPDDDKDVELQQKRLIKYIARKTKIGRENIKMASEDEIKTAIDKADASTLIYTGYSVYNTQDGKILRRIDPNRGFKPGHWIIVVTLSAAVIATSLILSGVL